MKFYVRPAGTGRDLSGYVRKGRDLSIKPCKMRIHPRYFIFSLMMSIFLLNSCNFDLKRGYSPEKAAKLHQEIITIDSHTDTPMNLMEKGFDFGVRHDPVEAGSKIDLPRMEEGGLDGLFFGVFIGQGRRDGQGDSAATSEAFRITDSIYATVNRFHDRMEIAREPADIYRIVKEGKHAVFIGMENGYPVENDISLIDSFYRRGVRYITLCHSKNNDICDSSTDPSGPEYGGLSELGEKVVRKMNDLGIMIDISHASDETFYDVLRLSRAPVIASHSCARAVCDNPRNIDDDMLKKLAGNGGVIQLCILSDYIETPAPFPARDSARQALKDSFGDYYSLSETGKEAFMKEWHQVDIDFPPFLRMCKRWWIILIISSASPG